MPDVAKKKRKKVIDPGKKFGTKSCDEMSHNEMVEWARGYLLIAIGEGKFKDAVWMVVNQSWKGGYNLHKAQMDKKGD